MTPEVDAPAGAGSPLEHLRLAYRARKALEAFRDRLDLIDVNREALSPDLSLESGYEGDFLVAILDLRLLVVVLAGVTDPANLISIATSDRVQRTLEAWPDIEAIALVLDDPDLTTAVFDTFDRPETVRAPGGQMAYLQPPVGPEPLLSAVAEYLDLFGIDWQVVGTLPTVELADTAAQAADMARAALDERATRDLRVPAKIAARDDLSDADADWAKGLALRVYEAGVLGDLSADLERIAEEGRS